MVSTSETGHSKNVANFEELISYVLTLAADYDPPKSSLKPAALGSKAVEAKNAISALNTVLGIYKNALVARKTAFKALSKYVTRVLNILKATDSTVLLDESARSIVRKIRGSRVSPKLTDAEKKANTEAGKIVIEKSSSQMSYDNRLDNLDKFIKFLATIPEYTPNEASLKLTGITAVYNDLKTKNTAAVTAETQLEAAREQRNIVLYKPVTGLVDIAVDTKTYIKAVFGQSSTQYKKVSRLAFISRAVNQM
jgi:hypothetical protein